MKPITALFPKYENYKDSGVSWLGYMPEHWKAEKSKWLFTKANRPVQQKDEVVTCFRDGQVTLRKNRRLEGFTNAIQEHGYQGIKKGDLIIHAMDAFAGAIGVSDSNGKSSPVYSACISRLEGTVNAYYYAYYLRSLALSGFIVSLSKGIRERSTDFRFNEFSTLLLPYAPLQEQAAIANFLDKQTAKIDRTIIIKEQQIARLKEYQQIIIQKAVTQGLNPDVPMKDSGVEWIGKIPEHWKVEKLKFISTLTTSNVDKHTKKSEFPIKLANYVDVYKNNYITSNIEFMQATATKEEMQKFKIKINDVLITKDSEDWKDIGVPALVKYENDNLLCGYHLAIIRSNYFINGNFLFWYLFAKSSRIQFSLNANGVTRYGISHNTIKNIWITFPNIVEQKSIVNHIETESHKIEQAIALQQAQIEKLKEYKTTLINSAVTGKIKVV